MIALMETSVTIILLFALFDRVNSQSANSYYNSPNFFKPRFIPGTAMGILASVAFPIDLPGRETYCGWYFEMAYDTPSNETSYDYPPLVSRTLNRYMIYEAVEKKLELTGFPGKSCLLRTICEASVHAFDKGNGLLGDVLHIILTPSSSIDFGLPPEYVEAEETGRKLKECSRYHNDCSVSLLDFIGFIGNSFH